ARHADLHEHETTPELGVALQEQVEGAHPFGDSLGVVDPVDTQSEPFAVETEPLAPDEHLLLDVRGGSASLVVLEVDRDGERPYEGGFSTANDLEALPVCTGLDGVLDRREEVMAVVTEVKPEQVVAEQPVE